jgi:O-acetyl-ADP-ribose deacetylase (regulator of RNase III)
VIRFEQGDPQTASVDALVVSVTGAPGHLSVHDAGRPGPRRYIIDFPTKRHPSDKARLIDVDLGLTALVEVVRDLPAKSIAIPALGCDDGEIAWSEVRPLIKAACDQFPEVTALVYAPAVTTREGPVPGRGARPVTPTAEPRTTRPDSDQG